MEERNKKIRLYIIIGTVVLIILLFVIALLQSLSRTNNTPQQQEQSLTPSVAPTLASDLLYLTPGTGPTIYQETQDYKEAQQEVDEQSAEFIEKGNEVVKLRTNSPVQGTLFTLSYDYNTFTFILTIPEAQAIEGNDEFNSYLQERGLTREDLGELIVRYN